MAAPEEPPSLRVIAGRVTAERESMRSHAEGLDTKAGVVLGFAGVLVGLGASAPDLIGRSPLCAAGLVLGMGSAVLAAAAFIPQRYPVLSARQLRDKYLTGSEVQTTLALLDTEIAMIASMGELVTRKGRFLKGAVACLAGAAALIVGGTLMAGGQGNAGPATPTGQSSQGHASATSQPARPAPVPTGP